MIEAVIEAQIVTGQFQFEFHEGSQVDFVEADHLEAEQVDHLEAVQVDLLVMDKSCGYAL